MNGGDGYEWRTDSDQGIEVAGTKASCRTPQAWIQRRDEFGTASVQTQSGNSSVVGTNGNIKNPAAPAKAGADGSIGSRPSRLPANPAESQKFVVPAKAGTQELATEIPVGVDGARRHRLCQTADCHNHSQGKPSDDDYQDRVGYIQERLSSARGRRAGAAGDAPAVATGSDREVFCQAAADADRAGSLRRLAPLGAGAPRTGGTRSC
jgi:hypothetical protein